MALIKLRGDDRSKEKQIGQALDVGSNVRVNIRLEYPADGLATPMTLIVDDYTNGIFKRFKFEQN